MDNTTDMPITEQVPPMNFIQRLWGMVFEPGKTFLDIQRKSTWLGIFILISLLSVAVQYSITSRIPREVRIIKGLEASPIQISEKQKEELLNRPPSAWESYAPLFTPVFTLIMFLILAGIFLLAFMVAGASLDYKKALSVSFWAMAPPSIVNSLLSILLIYLKDPVTLNVDPAKNLVSNLGPLVDDRAHPALASLLGSIDVFSIWAIFLLAIGFATIGNTSIKKSAGVILILWAIYILRKLGVYALIGGFSRLA